MATPLSSLEQRGGPCRHWIKVENPESPAMKRAAEVDWSR
jgi:hypothetical protein